MTERLPATKGRPRGRPQKMTSGKRVNVYLDSTSLDRASVLGSGNVSAGIRAALSAPDTTPESGQHM